MTDDSSAKAFLKHCPALLWIVGADGSFSEIHGDAAALFGIGETELKGYRPEAALDPTLGEHWRNRFIRALAARHFACGSAERMPPGM